MIPEYSKRIDATVSWSLIVIALLVVRMADCDAGIITGRTVRLNGVDAEPGVDIRALRVLSTGDVSEDVVGSATSRRNGTYAIDVGDTRVVQLEFRNSVSFTKLEKVVGIGNTNGLTVAVPAGAGAPEYQPSPPCCPPRRMFRRFRCASFEGETVTQLISSVRPATESAQVSSSGMREWTNRTGTITVTAKLVWANGEKARFERENGKTADALLSHLSAADQQWVKDWRASNALATTAQHR